MNKQILINYEEYLRLVDDSNYNNERFDNLTNEYVNNINELQQRIEKAIDTLTFSEKLKNDEIIPFLYQKIKETKSILRGKDNENI